MENKQDIHNSEPYVPETVIYNGEVLSAKQMKNYLGIYADKKCHKCHGRGWIGKDLEYKDGKPTGNSIHILCYCIKYDKRALYCGIRW